MNDKKGTNGRNSDKRRTGERYESVPKSGKPYRKPTDKPFKKDGERKPFEGKSSERPSRFEDKPFKKDGERKPFERRESKPFEDKPFKKDGERKPFERRENKPFEDKPFKKDGERKPFERRENKPFEDKPFKKDGERKPFERRENKPFGDKPFKKDGERKPFERRESSERPSRFEDKPFKKDGERKPFERRESKSFEDKPFKKDGERKPYEGKPFKKEEERKPAAANTTRLNKYVANSGVSSRRKADELILQGFVKVNGEVIKEMGFRVQPNDKVEFKDSAIRPEEEKVYFLLNKPKNTITTASDERGRKTVMDIMENVCEQRIYPVGRLDRDTTGLLLFTNDGELAKKLSHPSHEVKKIYHAILDKPLQLADLEKIRAGVTLEDGDAPVDTLEFDESDTTKKGVVMTIHIGRNRIVRRIFEHLDYTVVKLDRIYYGGLTKKNLGRGFHRALTKQEVIMLKHFV